MTGQRSERKQPGIVVNLQLFVLNGIYDQSINQTSHLWAKTDFNIANVSRSKNLVADWNGKLEILVRTIPKGKMLVPKKEHRIVEDHFLNLCHLYDSLSASCSMYMISGLIL